MTEKKPQPVEEKKDIMNPTARTVVEVLGFIALIVMGTERAIAWVRPPPPVPPTLVTEQMLAKEKAEGVQEHLRLSSNDVATNKRVDAVETAVHLVGAKVDAVDKNVSEMKTDIVLIKYQLGVRSPSSKLKTSTMLGE